MLVYSVPRLSLNLVSAEQLLCVSWHKFPPLSWHCTNLFHFSVRVRSFLTLSQTLKREEGVRSSLFSRLILAVPCSNVNNNSNFRRASTARTWSSCLYPYNPYNYIRFVLRQVKYPSVLYTMLFIGRRVLSFHP